MPFAKPSDSIQMNLFPQPKSETSIADFVTPKTYTGLASFHKYWGKKPTEGLCYLIEKCTNEGDIVMDPFLGSGLISLECLRRNRRFVGIDLNPFSIEHASFLLDLPSRQEYYQALIEIEDSIADKIRSTYVTAEGHIASHYLWAGDKLLSVWVKPDIGRNRIELEPSRLDETSFSTYRNYKPMHFRNLRFFTNSRINVKPTMTVSDIFTGRAMHNIDLLIESFSDYPAHVKRSLLLTLTSSSGQMSNMVFAIKNRSNRRGNGNGDKIEVGSWVIGFWLPDTHFEINVWNCFKNRANKLLKALPAKKQSAYAVLNDPKTVDIVNCDAWLINSDCRAALKKMPSQSISFVCTDPPHGDRIPYLELSELWNSLLGFNVDFETEIVVSNAKERSKSKTKYNVEMTEFFLEVSRVLKPNGYAALFFNARDEESWQYLKSIEETSGTLKFIGCFPMTYSATSVVQDNRKGALKSDYIIVYQKGQLSSQHEVTSKFANLPGWSSQFPTKKESKLK